MGVTDTLTEDHLTSAERIERGGPIACIAGALSFCGTLRASFIIKAIKPA